MKRLSNEEWKNIFRNMNDLHSDEILEFGHWIEVVWLDGSDEWVLSYAYEVFEDGFKTERDAQLRLAQLESELL